MITTAAARSSRRSSSENPTSSPPMSANDTTEIAVSTALLESRALPPRASPFWIALRSKWRPNVVRVPSRRNTTTPRAATSVSAARDNRRMADGVMVFLGFGKYVRADRIYALEPLPPDARGSGARTRVWVEGIAEPLIASRTEHAILVAMGAVSPRRTAAGRRTRTCSRRRVPRRIGLRRWHRKRDNRNVAFCPSCGRSLPAGARFCPSCANPVSEPAGSSEERKLATVLFADLVGSTELAGSQDPERTRALLNRFYDAMAVEIDDSGGTVEKFVGDAVMAAFGAPAAHEDHAERALHAALSMQRRLEELFGDALSLRIGVNTGDVVVGQPREGSSFVTGDAVNVAARLEQAAEPGEILVGERTATAVGGAFELGEPRTVAAKGKTEGVACRRLVHALSLMRPRGVGGLGHSFVGRERELEALQQAYGRVVDERKPRLVTIKGDAGIGKTTLIREFWEWLGSQRPETRRRTGRCQSYGRGITYLPIGEIVREHFGLLESDAPDTVQRRLGGRAILGLTLGLEAPPDLHPLAARDRLREAWVAFVEELVAEHPAVVLVEDLHWADDALLELLEAALDDVRGPLLLLATARPEFVYGRGHGETVLLEVLSESDASRMIDELIPAVLPASVRAVVVERAEGNPFFVEELVRTLIDQGVLARRNGSWTAHELAGDLVVPDNVQAVLAARIDLLGPADKAGLQAAAVIGRTFWSGAVYELLEDVEPNLRLLEERDFIRHRSVHRSSVNASS